MIALIIFAIFMVLMAIGVPVTISLGVSVLYGFVHAGFGGTLILLPMQILDGVDSPALLAIPFFVFAGNLMHAIGISDRIFNFAQALVGHMKAGLAQVNVLGSLFFGGFTGSAVADCAGIGNLEIRAMRKHGYPAPFACALTVVTSIIGPITWPSVPLLIYAFSAQVSVERIFLAGIGPGMLIVVALMIYNRAVADHYAVAPEPRASFAEIRATALDGLASLLAPAIIIGSTVSGFATPTEAGVVAVCYTLFLGIVYRQLTWARLWEALTESVLLSGSVMMIIGVSTALGWLLAIEQAPQELGGAVLAATGERWVFLGLTAIFLLLVGTLLEPIPAMVILIPMLLPLVDHFQVDRVHFGLITVFGLMLGIATPPVGVALFIVTKIAKIPFEQVCMAVLPLLIPLIVVLGVITFVPETVLWLPNLILGPAK